MHDHLALKGQLAMIARICGQDSQTHVELIEDTVIGWGQRQYVGCPFHQGMFVEWSHFVEQTLASQAPR